MGASLKLEYLEKIVSLGYNVITYGKDKKPNLQRWKEWQEWAYPFEMLKEQSKRLDTVGFGLVTGYNNVEVVDVDLKVLPTLKEQNDFWDSYLSFLKDNIFDFDNKFVIKQTISNGYHIIYRCSEIEGNKCLAKLEGHKSAIIETRGRGGYVCMYERTVGELDYHQIQEISVEDRDMLFFISRTFDFVDTKTIEAPKRSEVKEYTSQDVTTWDDFNAKTDIFDLIGNEFKIVRNLPDRTVILRHGAKSASSGYVYKNSRCMYLFSTGTSFPNEKLITPFTALMYRDFNGSFKDCCSYLYKEGFGTRIKRKEAKYTITENEIKDVKFPLSVYPDFFQKYILECNRTLDSSIDFLGSSLLWALSLSVGNSYSIKVQNGWIEKPVVWIALVGKAGIGKTPALNNIIAPLKKLNNKEIKRFIKEKSEFEAYEQLSKKEKDISVERKDPIKSQFLVGDITTEGLFDLHQEVKNGIGIFRDELSGFLRDMNKYRAGSDLEAYLSLWSGQGVSINRKTARNSFVEHPFVSLIGGIQPAILEEFYTEQNKENGFMDRMLLCYPNLKVSKYSNKEMCQQLIEHFNESLQYFFQIFNNEAKQNVTDDGEIIPHIATFSDEAKTEWVRIFNKITDTQNSDEENEYLKSMYPKQKTYIPRFALLLHLLDYAFNSFEVNPLEVSKKAILGAEKLSDYFVENAKNIKTSSTIVQESKFIINQHKGDKFAQFKALFDANNNLNRTQTAELLSVSCRTIHNWIKDLKNGDN